MTREERKRKEKAKARAQMGTLLSRRPQALVAFCVCGARVETAAEVVMCNGEHETKAGG